MPLRPIPQPPPPGCARLPEAALRLRSARRRFEASVVLLRRAALDHADAQALASLVLRASRERMAATAEA
ncbi:hypothetical protein [Methylobacterium sp. A54F]